MLLDRAVINSGPLVAVIAGAFQSDVAAPDSPRNDAMIFAIFHVKKSASNARPTCVERYDFCNIGQTWQAPHQFETHPVIAAACAASQPN